MNTHRSKFDPNQRVAAAADAFQRLQNGVMFKGFLGPSIRENNSYPSVGVSAARRSGVIVDDAGKMRCPPGTPNANQFTDLQMSNCMIPSAETAARNAAEVAARIASRSVDGFKRGNHGMSQKDSSLIPDAKVGFASENGFLEQRRIPKGNRVTSPRNGNEIALENIEDSIQYVSEGGALSNVPDEHLVRSIASNPERFEKIGSGGGMHGMNRYRDKSTNALIGIKYDSNWAGDPQEPVKEVASELFAEHMGYEPMPMRIALNVRQSEWGEEWGGIALVTELAHNRHPGSIEGARITDRKDGKYDYGIDPSEIVMMSLLDSVLGNLDRHEGNFMISRQDSGDSTLIPIDHSLTFFSGETRLQNIVKTQSAPGLEEVLSPYYEEGGMERLATDIARVQEILRNIDKDALRADIEKLFTHIGGLGLPPSKYMRDNIDSAIQRIEVLSNALPDEIAPLLAPEYKKRVRQVESLNDWADTPEAPRDIV